MSEKQVNGQTYRSQPMLATRATVLFAKIGKLLGPGLSDLIEAFASRPPKDGVSKKKHEEMSAKSNKAAIEAVMKLLADLEPEVAAELMKEILSTSEIMEEGQYIKINVDHHFTGRLGDLVPVMSFVLQEQFGDFFIGAQEAGNQPANQKA